jgi:A/G-specific adenine glycosylase
LPYYQKFIRRFPTIEKLAGAQEDEVLRLWQGLGYYTRARNLYRCAIKICRDLNGRFPSDYTGLLKLPGIGHYTAAAIASIAFNESRAVLDGNVFRVIARLYGINKNIADNRNRHIFEHRTNELIPDSSPGDFNQAIMELGATVCKPGEPVCPDCPLKKYCVAYSANLQHQLPVRHKKQKMKTRVFDYYIIHYRNRILMKKRSANDIWKGLYEFYMVEHKNQGEKKDPSGKIIQKMLKTCKAGQKSNIYKCLLSHQVIEARFRHLYVSSKSSLNDILKEPGIGLFTRNETELLPKPVLIDNYLKEGFF